MTFIIGTLVFSTFVAITVTTTGAGPATVRPSTTSCPPLPWELPCWPSGELRGEHDPPPLRTDLRLVELYLVVRRWGDCPQPVAHGDEEHRVLLHIMNCVRQPFWHATYLSPCASHVRIAVGSKRSRPPIFMQGI
jgi:hypothetical protein